MLTKKLWWLSRPFVWRWRLGYWDWDAAWVALGYAYGRWPKPRLEGECWSRAFTAFAAARVAEERERCARTVEKLYRTEPCDIDDGWITPSVRSRVRKRDAAAIRASGETEAPA